MPLPPAAKMPLAARKDVRDEFENNKASLEKEISDILGTEWKVDINPLAIWPYAEGGEGYAKQSPGACIKTYIEGAIWRMKYYIERNGDAGKNEINTICHAHTLTLGEDEAGKFSYCGCIIEDGSLKIVFNSKSLGTNTNGALEPLTDALNDAPNPSKAALSVKARLNIDQEYNKAAEELTKKFEDMLKVKPFTLNPMFKENFEVLKKGKNARDDWQQNLGDFTAKYFEGAEYMMKNKKFGEDDMLQEGFNESVDKNQIAFRVVEKLQKGTGYNEILLEDGILYIQTTPEYFGTNVTYAAEKIIDLL